jgi:hypothetical protein
MDVILKARELLLANVRHRPGSFFGAQGLSVFWILKAVSR